MEKAFSSETNLRRSYGLRMASVIKTRMEMLASLGNLAKLSMHTPGRMHPLSGDRKGQFAVDLTGPYRLVFEPDYDPVPLKADGGVDLEEVRAITILEVVDYH